MTVRRDWFLGLVRRLGGSQRPRSAGPVAAVVLFLLVACSGTLVPVASPPVPPTQGITAPTKTVAAAPETLTTTAQKPTGTAESPPSAAPARATVEIAVDTAAGRDELGYTPTTLTAPAGSRVKLKLSNKTNPDDEIGHDWVLVMPGTEDSVLASSLAAGDDGDWLDREDPGVIAASKLIEGATTDTITFDAPPPGTYTFLCTFPKHYAGGMKGTLTVP